MYLANEKALCKETLKQLKHNLECKNISNLVYVLCMERRKCEMHRVVLERQHNNAFAKVSKELEDAEGKISLLKEKLEKEYHRIKVREMCLRSILEQFQKFVYFALQAAPKQAEFLLNVEKLLLFELTAVIKENASLPTKKQHVSEPRVADAASDHDEEPCGLKLPPDHNCSNEVDDPNEQDQDLLSVVYNTRMYVREDIRNMVSRGLEIRPSNELWNKDVECLMTQLKQSVSQPAADTLTSANALFKRRMTDRFSSITNPPGVYTENIVNTSSHPSRTLDRVSVRFDSKAEVDIPTDKADGETQLLLKQSSVEKQILTNCLLESVNIIPGEENIKPVRRTSVLIDSSDSLTRLRQKNTELMKDYWQELEQSLNGPGSKFRNKDNHSCVNTSEKSFESERTREHKSSAVAHSSKAPHYPRTSFSAKNGIKNSSSEVHGGVENRSRRASRQSVLSFAQDSLTLLKRKEKPNSSTFQLNTLRKSGKIGSKLSLHCDSLELIKVKPVNSKEKTAELIQAQNEEVDIQRTRLVSRHERVPMVDASKGRRPLSGHRKNKQQNPHVASETVRHQKQLEQSPSKDVLFAPVTEVYHTEIIPDATWKVYDSSSMVSDEIQHSVGRRWSAQPQILSIIGDERSIKSEMDLFTADRVQSLIGILRDDTSLLRMFTSCQR